MGDRMDWHHGLSERARALVAGCGKPHYSRKTQPTKVVLPDGNEAVIRVPVLESCVRVEPSGEHYTGMFDDEYPLHKYTLRNGTVYCERVQVADWDSGPNFFIALVDEKGEWVQESLWTKEEIEAKL